MASWTGSSRVCFDEVVVDRRAMLVTRAGKRVDLEPKAYDVLLHLMEHPGQLVTKDELIASVWKGVAVTDHVLTRAIGQLRRGLGDAAREARYIETVPTRGYRFIASLEADREGIPSSGNGVPAASEPAPAAEVETGLSRPGSLEAPAPRWRWRLRPALWIVAGLVAAGFVGWAVARGLTDRDRESAWTDPPAKPRQLTFAPALDVYPDFSPDGRFLAYATSASGAFELEVRPMARDARAQRITNDRGGSIQPDWSPDGQLLAYHSMVSGGIWVVPALGGVPRRLVAVGSSPAWSPDGRQIAFQSGEPATVEIGGTPPPSQLRMFDVSGGTTRALTRGGHPAGGHTEPAWSPDGARVAFVVRGIARAEVWSVPAAGGDPTFVWGCRENCSRVTYEPGGRALIFAVSGQGYYRLPLDPASGSAAGPPVLLVAQRADVAGQIALSPDGRSAAFTEIVVRSHVAAVPLDPAGRPAGEPGPVTTTTGRVMTPAYEPTGTRIAFVARREAMQVCLVPASGGEVTPLPIPTGFAATFRPAWTPAGGLLAVAAGAASSAIVAIDPASRETRVLLSLGAADVAGNARFLAPSFFADGRRMTFGREEGDGVSIWTMDLASGELRRLTPSAANGTFPTPSPDGRLVAYERVLDGSMHAMVVPAGGGEPRQLTTGRGLTWPHSWSPDGSRLYAAFRRGDRWSIGWLSIATGEITVLATLPTPHGYVRYPSVSPGGDRVAYEQTEATGNIWQVNLWNAAGGMGSPVP